MVNGDKVCTALLKAIAGKKFGDRSRKVKVSIWSDYINLDSSIQVNVIEKNCLGLSRAIAILQKVKY